MVTRSAPAPAETPILQPVRTGLLRSAGPLLAERWGTGGVAYRPNTSFPGESFDPCNVAPLTLDEEGVIEWTPWGHATGSECLALSRGPDGRIDEETRAVQRYNAQISHMVEQVFWTGDLDDGTSFVGNGWDNRPLADPAAVELTGINPVGVLTAFAFAYEYLADTIGGLRGMIHIPYRLLPLLAFYGVGIRNSGFGIDTTLADHIIVAGTGYPGTAPDGSPAESGSTWMYVTSLVRAAASEPSAQSHLSFRVESVEEGGNNHWETIASGLALAEWDLAAHAAVQVCLTDPGPDCEPGVS